MKPSRRSCNQGKMKVTVTKKTYQRTEIIESDLTVLDKRAQLWEALFVKIMNLSGNKDISQNFSINKTVNSTDSEDQVTGCESEEKLKDKMEECKLILQSYVDVTHCGEAVVAVETFDPNLLEAIFNDMYCQNTAALPILEKQRKETLAVVEKAKQHFEVLKKRYVFQYIAYVSFMYEVMTYLANKYKDA